MRWKLQFLAKTTHAVLVSVVIFATTSAAVSAEKPAQQMFRLANDQVTFSVLFSHGMLVSDRLQTKAEWSARFQGQAVSLQTDADFSLNVMWTGWRAPGKINNAENPVQFTKNDFILIRGKNNQDENGVSEMQLFFRGKNNPFQLKIIYQLNADDFFIRRKIAVRDTVKKLHFLRKISARCGGIKGVGKIIKAGGFGQPVAFLTGSGGGFFGMEYPTSENSLVQSPGKETTLTCSQIVGHKITDKWRESDWVVEAVTPNRFVKNWFSKYLDRIRVAPLRPYTLYNSWYDLRAPEIVKDSLHVMNEKNIRRIIGLFRRNMIEKYDIHLDAFVLDDGWDIYKSDWVLRPHEFPDGLKPIANELAKDGTDLGIWFGPIGGYSHRDWRIGWMRQHGYEVVGDQFCLAGKNYSQLFKKRVVDFVEKDGVGYYKWDGIQFSCSEPNHGHPIGIYSRRAVMDTVIQLCRAVRAKNPNIYLNITSGTWLSPWWLKYTNQVWMQGNDFGYSNVPSVSRRDRAITYRDFNLYDDLQKNNFWFPIANLMTVGIIKGNLRMLGGEQEPLDKFTDNALLSFARGISMWALYISPDLLKDDEWNAISKSIQWAKDRFPILKSTEMIGGDPGERKAYGYAHFAGKRGIIAARNPFVEPEKLMATLSPAQGLDPQAASLVLERVYPSRWISPNLYAAGAQIEIPLQGYETAIYEIYPLDQAEWPLLSGVVFDVAQSAGEKYAINLYDVSKNARLLNPEKIKQIRFDDVPVTLQNFALPQKQPSPSVLSPSFSKSRGKKNIKADMAFHLAPSVTQARLAVLLQSDSELGKRPFPEVQMILDGEKVSVRIEQQEGRWQWISIPVSSTQHKARLVVPVRKKSEQWHGKLSAWLICRQKPEANRLTLTVLQKVKSRPLPPRPWPMGEFRRTIKLGETIINDEG